jgi:D-tyrosyl-tRNA(Tyr) deacylase
MKAVIQRVLSASVAVNGNEIGTINQGFLILLGIEKDDVPEDLDYMLHKTVGLRIFKDEQNNMNLSIQDVAGEALVVSQFSLCADTSKGRRPSFINAAPPEIAKSTYEKFCKKLQDENVPVQMGRFGTMMEVGLTNDGPVTILLDSRNRK